MELPKPLLATLGMLAQARRLPARAAELSILALTAADSARRSYQELSERGEQVLTQLFGGGETTNEPGIVPTPVVQEESAVVLDAVAHVEDPLDRPRTLPEPVPGYDGLTLGALRGKLRTLSAADLERILTYEKAHQGRAPMMTLVEHRLAKLALG